MASVDEDVVVVTGFGPFGEHKVNSSWEVAKLLPTLGLEEDLNVKLVIQEIPVEYKTVSEKIPALWLEYKPVLMLHLGVSSLASGLTLERCARGTGYNKPDIRDEIPPNECCCSDDTVHCQLDVKSACRAVNDMRLPGLTSQTSTYAGLYLCEYAFRTSLNVDAGRSLFVHVPPLDKGLTAKEMAEGVARIVVEAVKEIRAR